jgi:hypothetical protein
MHPNSFTSQLNAWIDRLSRIEEEAAPQPNGILNGRMGRALIYAAAYRYSDQPLFENKAQQLLTYITEQIGQEDRLHFGKGIMGIGWAIEWMAQNKFIDENTDEVLADIDDEIYKSVIYEKSDSLSQQVGVLAKALYFFTRYQCMNPGTPRYKTIANIECLILLIDEINEQLFDKDKGILAAPLLPPSDIADIASALILLSRISLLRIYPEITMRIIKGIVNFIIGECEGDHIRSLRDTPDKQAVCAYLKLGYACYVAGNLCRRVEWQSKGKAMFDSLTTNPHEGIYDQPAIVELFSQFYLKTRSVKYLSLIEQHINIEKYLEAPHISIADGAGLFLSLMSIQKPQLPKSTEILLL